MQTRILVSAVALTALLQGCGATMSKDECLVSDWRTIGYEDGARGQAPDRIGRHRQACAKHSVSPDLTAYQAGRAEGLEEFCQPENGFEFGSRGGTYRGVCPDSLADDFLASYRQGKQLYALEAGVRSTTSKINARRRRLEQIDEQLITETVRVIREDTTPTERAELLVNAKHLAEERGRINAEMPELIRRKAILEEELIDYREQLASSY